MPEFNAELSVAVTAVQTAARVCQAVQRRIGSDAMEKKDRSPVTIADFASQAVVCRALAESFPEDPVVGEEDSAELQQSENAAYLKSVRTELRNIGIDADEATVCRWIDHGNGQSADRFWTLDPIDGTKGFLRGEQYAISLALIVDGQISVAVLGCPNLPFGPGQSDAEGALFFAVRGQGAFVVPVNDEGFDPETAQQVQVSTATEWAEARLCESVESGHSSHSRSARLAQSLGMVREPVRLDSQAKYAVVARGEADIYLRLPTRADYREKIWDHAGGVLIVEEAGGRVSDVAGQPLDFTRGKELTDNRGVVVTSGPFHDGVLKALSDAGVG